MYLIGHIAPAVAFRKNNKMWFLLYCMFLCILPDFDFFFGWAGIEHHTITHSIFFAIVIGYLSSIPFKKYQLYFTMLVLSHPLIDMFCSDPYHHGVMFFWPISYKFYWFHWHNFPSEPVLYSEGLELLFLIVFVLIIEWTKIVSKFERVVSTYVINMWRH